MLLTSRAHAASAPRLWIAAALMCACAALLVWRWAYLQVENFSHFSELAHENQVKLLPVEPPRGLIFDRSGRQLAGNKTIFSLRVGSDFAGETLGKIDALTTAVHIPPAALKRLREAVGSSVYKGDIVLREKLSEEEITQFISWQFLFPEVIMEASLARDYPHHDSGGHVLGFVGRINPKDVARLKEAGRYGDYRGANFIGKTGVELMNESRLRGRLGSQEVQVDAHGRILKRRLIKPPAQGEDVYLTLDWELQQLAEQLLAGERGAAVMMEIDTGKILVLGSSPRFDINKFVFGISQGDWDALNHSDDKPLIHRAIYGQYAPGSTVKPFLALASLQHGWRDLSYEYFSRGFFQLTPKHVFHDWKKGGHGKVDVTKSIVRSVNSYYYQLGHDVGIDAMHEALSVFGFGSKTEIDLDNEKAGVLPSTEWKLAALGEQWYPGDTIAASVGQGYVQVTPLQMARAMAVIAGGGRQVRPYLAINPPPAAAAAEFEPHFLQTVRDAMALVTKPGGTAARIGRDSLRPIAGKTGTAQVSRLRRDASGARIKNEDLPKHLRDHAWFAGYAPAEAPQVAVAVIVENSGSGGRIAGPIVRELVNAYFQASAPEEDSPDAAEESEETEETEEAGSEAGGDSGAPAATAFAPPRGRATDGR